MKLKNKQNQNFFLFLQYSNIHTGISNEVLKVYNNYSKEYFENKKFNRKRYDELFKKSESYLDKILLFILVIDIQSLFIPFLFIIYIIKKVEDFKNI